MKPNKGDNKNKKLSLFKNLIKSMILEIHWNLLFKFSIVLNGREWRLLVEDCILKIWSCCHDKENHSKDNPGEYNHNEDYHKKANHDKKDHNKDDHDKDNHNKDNQDKDN